MAFLLSVPGASGQLSMRNWSIGGSGFAFWKFVNRDVNTAGLGPGLIGGLPAAVAACCLQHVTQVPGEFLKGVHAAAH